MTPERFNNAVIFVLKGVKVLADSESLDKDIVMKQEAAAILEEIRTLVEDDSIESDSPRKTRTKKKLPANEEPTVT